VTTNWEWATALAIAAALLLGWLIGEFVLGYSVRDGMLSIKLFGLAPLRRIQLRDVNGVSAIRFSDWNPFSTNYGWCERYGGLMLLFRGVAITLINGKTLLIAPRHRARFMAAITAAKKVSVCDLNSTGRGRAR
jgi:hypothetical protein